jgi:ribosome production factor 2
MLRTPKPKNARSKRALDARLPKEIEDARTAIFVHGTKCGGVVKDAMKDLLSLKRPDAISFSKKNEVRPFDSTDSFEFWSGKNDAGMFVVGHSTKKRPNGMVFIRMFDGRVLDMVEMGIEGYVGLSEIKVRIGSTTFNTIHLSN